MAIEELRVSFPCPTCKESFPVSLYQLLEGGIIFCPVCQATNAEAEIAELERNLKTIGQSIQNLKKCLNEKSRLGRL